MKKRNKRIIAFAIVLLIIIGINIVPYVESINSGAVYNNYNIGNEESNLLNFIDNKLCNEDGGIRTNYINEASNGDITKGNDVLSESEGLKLLYYIERDRKVEFDNTINYIKNNMILDNGLISWRMEGGQKNPTSAAIDDLRIVKALLLGSERWSNIKYRYFAFKIAKSIKKELNEGNLIADFNDGTNKSDKTTICYLDIFAFKLLSEFDSDYEKIYERSKRVLDDAYLGDKIPLYAKEYNRKDNSYDNGDVDVLLSSIVLLNKAQCGEDISTSINYLKDKYKNEGGIFALYNRQGQAVSNVESISIYANLFCIADIINDAELYNICLQKLRGYQVNNQSSEIFGAYGDVNTLQVFSFDNLNALLAWSRYKN